MAFQRYFPEDSALLSTAQITWLKSFLEEKGRECRVVSLKLRHGQSTLAVQLGKPLCAFLCEANSFVQATNA